MEDVPSLTVFFGTTELRLNRSFTVFAETLSLSDGINRIDYVKFVNKNSTYFVRRTKTKFADLSYISIPCQQLKMFNTDNT